MTVTFKDVAIGYMGLVTVPAPLGKGGYEDVKIYLYSNHVALKSSSIDTRLDEYSTYTYIDCNHRHVSIKHEGFNVWNELKISVTIED